MNPRSLFSRLLLLALFYASAAYSQQLGRTLYVNNTDPTCHGKSPCYSSIQAAVNAAFQRDVIQIQAGKYVESVLISDKNDSNTASETDRIIIERDPADESGSVVVTAAGGACGNGDAFKIQRSKFITIRGITITGGKGSAIALLGGSNQNRAIHIERNRIFANGTPECNGGITVGKGNPDTLIVNNFLYGNGRIGIAFHDGQGGPHYVIGNTVHANGWAGVSIARSHRVLLANNVITQNGRAKGSTGRRFGVNREASGNPNLEDVQLLHNLVCGNGPGELSGPILDSTDSGNLTPQGNEGPGVSSSPGCDIPGNVYGALNGTDGIPNTIDDDFRLKAGSAAIDKGIDPRTLGLERLFESLFLADYEEDDARPEDGDMNGLAAFDMGASEAPGDHIPPQVAFVQPAESQFIRQTVTVEVQAADNFAISTLGVSSGDQPFPIAITPALPAPGVTAFGLWNTTRVNDGVVELKAIAADTSGNQSGAIRTVIVDNTSPDTHITGGPGAQHSQTSATFTFSGSDNLTATADLVFAWRVNGGSYSPFSSATSATIDGLIPGAYTFEVLARDLAGNDDPVPASMTFVVVRLGPTIAAVDPTVAAIGTVVTITGTEFEPGNTTVSFNGVAAVLQTISTTSITTLVPPNASTGPLSVTTSRGSASRDFTVSTTQDFQVVVSPVTVQVVQNGFATAVVDVIASNGFSGLVKLVATTPPGATLAFSTSTLVPNSHALLTLRPTLDTPAGVHTIEIHGTAQIEGRLVTRSGTLTLNVTPPGQTVLTGRILDGNERPLPGVSIKLGGSTLTHLGSSDAGGNVFIPLSLAGRHVFLIDGSTANSANIHYPTVPITLDIQPGIANELGYVPRLQGQPIGKLIPIIPGQAMEISDPDLPGFKMTIPEGVQIIGWDGQPNTQFAVTTVPIDRSPLPPLPLPPGFEARQTYLFSFGKMGGGVPTGNIHIDSPNIFGALPGEQVDLYYFNEAPDGTAPNQWEKYGTATVSADGTTLVTDINPATGLPYGIPRFCCGAFTPVFRFLSRPFGVSGGPRDGGRRAGDPVDVATGLFYVEKVDMVLSGRLPAVVTRTYRTNQENAGPFGPGTSASFDISLRAPSIFDNRTLVLISPGNKQDIFSLQSNGVYLNTTSPSLRGAVLTDAGPSTNPRWLLRFKDGKTWRFNAFGSLVAESDRNGNTVSFGRDNFNRVVSISEPAGRSLVLNYGPPGLGLTSVLSVTDPIGRQVRYSYDEAGRLETVTDPEGGITRYAYDSAGRMISLTDPRGITFLTNEYDEAGRVVRQVQGDGGVWTFEYTNSGSYISESTVTDPRGQKTTYRFNAAGYQTSETDALGRTTIIERQPGTNLILSITDALKRVTRLEYDSAGNVARIIDASGASRRFSYEPVFNQLLAITDPLGNITQFEYDARGNTTAIVGPLQHRVTIAYNQFGQAVIRTDPLENSIGFNYNEFGDVVEIVDPLGHRSKRTYDAVSRLVSRIDPRGKVTKYTYDGLNRITGIIDAIGGTTQFTYDGNSNLVAVRDPRGNTTTYTYDSMDRLAGRTGPLGASESYHYDGVGNLIQYEDRKGQQSLFSYDPVNRRIGAQYQDGTTTTYTYDGGSRLIEASDSVGGTIVNHYDIIDRMTAQITSLGVVSYDYDAAGRRTQMSVTGQAPITYSYDPASRLRQIAQAEHLVDISYDAAGRRTAIRFSNGVSTEYQYDQASRVRAIVYKNATGTLGDLTYHYDKAGNRIGVGGSFARTLLPNPVHSSTYDAANRQLSFGDITATFDANGSATALSGPSSSVSLTWDSRNRLVGMSSPQGLVSFRYDALGRRTGKTTSLQETNYLYDGLNVVQEASKNTIQADLLTGLAVDEYFHRTHRLNGSSEWFLTDPLASVLALVSSAGQLQQEYSYAPFGTAPDVLNGNPYLYTGREADETGFYYYRARYYRPDLARFISEDPFQLATVQANANDVVRTNLLGLLVPNMFVPTNLYSYVENNPLLYNDPLGLVKGVPSASELLNGVYTGAFGGLIEGFVTNGNFREIAMGTYMGGLMGMIPVPPGPLGATVGAITGAITGITARAAGGDATAFDLVVAGISGAAGGAVVGAVAGPVGFVAGIAAGITVEATANMLLKCYRNRKKC